MPTISVSRFLRERRDSYLRWREHGVRKEAELKESSSKARLKGTEQAKKAHLARLQARKAELKITIDLRKREREDLRSLKEQNDEWMNEAEGMLKGIRERINYYQR